MTFDSGARIFSPFLDRTVAARRHEKTDESATGIIPGNRGKEHGNWCRAPLCGASRVQAYVTSSSGRGRTRSSNANMELCGEARTQKPRPSRVRSGVSFGPRIHAVTQRVVVATVSPGRCAALRWVHPTKRPGPQGWARNGQGTTGSGRVWQSSQNLLLGAVP